MATNPRIKYTDPVALRMADWYVEQEAQSQSRLDILHGCNLEGGYCVIVNPHDLVARTAYDTSIQLAPASRRSAWKPPFLADWGEGYPKETVLSTMKALARRAAAGAEESSVTTAAELADVLIEINNLAFTPESDEYGLVRPSFHALTGCLKLLLGMTALSGTWKPSSISTDPNAAIRIAWTSQDRETELVCPFEESEEPYIYISWADNYEVINEVNSEILARQIRWAIGGE